MLVGEFGKNENLLKNIVSPRKPKAVALVVRRQLVDVLRDEPAGLDPLQLLQSAGYELADVEVFYRDLAVAIAKGQVHERRPDRDTVNLSA